VTTAGDAAARNFSLQDQPAHARRYERAAEFLDVARRLWDSWEDGAPVGDKAAGIWGDNFRVHPVNHAGTYFSVQGPLDVPRSAQGHPVIVQAGSSEDGKDFAARYAEAVFTAQQTCRTRSASMPTSNAGPQPPALIHPVHARRQLAGVLRVAPESLALDAQLPDDLPSEDQIEGAKSRYTLIVDLARREQLTVRQLIGRLGGGRGHRTFSGTPEQVADAIQDLFQAGAADGSTSCRPSSHPASTPSWTMSSRSCGTADSSGVNTPDGPCANTTACRGLPTPSPRALRAERTTPMVRRRRRSSSRNDDRGRPEQGSVRAFHRGWRHGIFCLGSGVPLAIPLVILLLIPSSKAEAYDDNSCDLP
jgi:alkanesulfonate monooxygenase SsuD/methylene tetrahydromethanopterin reductase-like flavin-dependent oxidoreductase (luciferase family)